MAEVTLLDAAELALLQEEIEALVAGLSILAAKMDAPGPKALFEDMVERLTRLTAVMIKAGIWVEEEAN